MPFKVRKTIIHTEDAPSSFLVSYWGLNSKQGIREGNYPQATLATYLGNVSLQTSGQIGRKPGKKQMPAVTDYDSETMQAMINLQNIISSTGLDLGDIDYVFFRIADTDQIETVEHTYQSFFKQFDRLPTRDIVGSRVPYGAHVAISMRVDMADLEKLTEEYQQKLGVDMEAYKKFQGLIKKL